MDYFDYSHIPDSTLESIDAYAEEGRPTGRFLEAVISNDLRQACARADLSNRAALVHIVMYMTNETPLRCWGSPEAYEEWTKRWTA